MASIAKDPGGKKRILFIDHNGKRKTIRLGKMPMSDARTIKYRIESLLAAKTSGQPLDNETGSWLRDIPGVMAEKLAKYRLIESRSNNAMAIGMFLDKYMAKRTDLKGGTKVAYGHTVRNLKTFFGECKSLRAITKGDADDFRRYLIDQGLATATVNRRCGLAKTFLRAAVRHELIQRNPFEDLKGAARGNRERMRFVDRATIQKVIDACPDTQWRLLAVLARYGGLRTPSESLSLRWDDIDWHQELITIHSPKTEHHPNGATRVIPIFPELKSYLQEAWDAAKPGQKYIIDRWRETAQKTEAGWKGLNLRTHFLRIIKKTDVDPWPKPWQNLRSSRETELAEKFPIHVVCAWIGNSQAVAKEHYLQITDEHFRKGAQEWTGKNVAQNAAQSGHVRDRKAPKAPAMPQKVGPIENCSKSAPDKGLPPGADPYRKSFEDKGLQKVGARGFEPRTSSLSGTRSKPTELCALTGLGAGRVSWRD